MKQILQILADYLNKVRRKLEKVIKSDIKNYIKLKAQNKKVKGKNKTDRNMKTPVMNKVTTTHK